MRNAAITMLTTAAFGYCVSASAALLALVRSDDHLLLSSMPLLFGAIALHVVGAQIRPDTP